MDIKNFEYYYSNNMKLTKLSVVPLVTALVCSILGYPVAIYPAWIAISILKNLANHNLDKCAESLEYNILRDSYQFVLENIIKLAKDINFTNVEEIYVLFEYLLFNNLLSYNQEDKKESIKTLPKEISIQAPLTLNNHGCCRNNSLVLADIYQGLDIEAGLQIGISINTGFEIPEELKTLLKELISSHTGSKEDAYEFLDNPVLIGKSLEDYINKTIKNNKKGNHAITVVNYGNKSYYFDATLHHALFPSENYSDRLEDGNGAYFITKVKPSKNLNKYISGITSGRYPCSDEITTMTNIIDASERIMEYDDNLDIFHNTINEALYDAEEAIKSIRKSMR